MFVASRLLAKAPRDPNERRVLAASFADALGTGLFLPLSVIYLTRIVGLSPTRVGLGLTVAGSAAVAATLLAGTLLGFALAAGAPPLVAFGLLVLALGALTVAELENTAGEWFLSVELAPARLRGRYLSVFKTSMALQQAIGPALVTTALVKGGRVGWLALALVLGAGALASRQLGARALGRRPPLPFDRDADAEDRR